MRILVMDDDAAALGATVARLREAHPELDVVAADRRWVAGQTELMAGLAHAHGLIQAGLTPHDNTGHGLAAVNRDLDRRYVEQLRILSQQLVEVQENERRAIARELHDEAGQALTTLKLGLGLLEREAGLPDQVVARARDLNAVVDGVMEDLHRLAARLRPATLDRLGLVPALQQFVSSFERVHGLRAQFAALGLDGVRLAPDVEIALYRVVQESLTNVARHAQATRVDVLLRCHNGRIAGVIEDDGIGFALSEAFQGGRLGLFGMQERAEVLGGKLQVESEPGRGTTVYVELPSA